MKKQLLTSALALSMMLGTTGMAFAADTPSDMTATAKMANVTITTVGDDAAASLADADAFKFSEQKVYTAETYAAEIKNAKAGLDKAVQEKQMTREEADRVLTQMEQNLKEIKAGTLTLHYADLLDKDGNVVGQVCSAQAAAVSTNGLIEMDICTTTAE